MATYIKQETIQPTIDISDSDSETGSNDITIYNIDGGVKKKQKIEVALPLGFLDPISKTNEVFVLHPTKVGETNESCKQFWKAGDYEGGNGCRSTSLTVGMDHLRVHPKFLHSNATSHKWALGALAELLDNALDEVCNGATFVHIDMLKNKKDNTKMLLVEDNGGGMTPDTMRQCMSLGYSVKSKLANTIGQYGNGFKTSTMRLGADVIVFSRNRGKDGRSPTQSIGLLSYTFLRRTGKEDIVVPMIDYEKRGEDWKMTVRSSPDDWKRNVETIVQWSPYASEDELLQQFNFLEDQGTRIVIYNLWEDDQGALELDFDTDYDIQIRGVNRDDTKIEMAKNYPNCRHFLTYRHSLRSYAAILYLSIPPSFRIILRGKDVDHHNLLDDMMLSQEIKYKPVAIADGTVNQNMLAVGTIGFVKDAKSHVDVQGFNVYHKNRLIKPFWRVWNAAGSDGRGVIGVLEANFVEPAHDKQGFERTNVLSKLEARLVAMQKNYWKSNCHLIGYAKRRNIKKSVSPEKGSNSGGARQGCAPMGTTTQQGCVSMGTTGQGCASMGTTGQGYSAMGTSDQLTGSLCIQVAGTNGDGHAYAYADPITQIIPKLKEENLEPIQRPEQVDGLMMVDLLRDLQLERDRSNWFENEFQNAQKRIEEMDKEQVTLINVFSEERERRDKEEESLRNLLKDAYDRIQGLINKVKLLESKSGVSCKIEP